MKIEGVNIRIILTNNDLKIIPSILKHVSAISALVGLYLYIQLSLIEKRDNYEHQTDKLIFNK